EVDVMEVRYYTRIRHTQVGIWRDLPYDLYVCYFTYNACEINAFNNVTIKNTRYLKISIKRTDSDMRYKINDNSLSSSIRYASNLITSLGRDIHSFGNLDVHILGVVYRKGLDPDSLIGNFYFVHLRWMIYNSILTVSFLQPDCYGAYLILVEYLDIDLVKLNKISCGLYDTTIILFRWIHHLASYSLKLEVQNSTNFFQCHMFRNICFVVCVLANISTLRCNRQLYSNNILGQVGFGIVYKGCLKNGALVAVKRLKDLDVTSEV
ncbi:hypothetical protein ACJX0J_042201, partial [Zea mays]